MVFLMHFFSDLINYTVQSNLIEPELSLPGLHIG